MQNTQPNYGLIPLLNFAQVDDKIFRSAQPIHEYQYDFVSDVLGVGLLINLRSEAHIDDKLAPSEGMAVINIDIPDHKAPTVEDVKKFVKAYKHFEGTKMLIHCAHGRGRTTTFCVIARMLQGWSLDQAIAEQTDRFLYTFKHPVQLEFLKNLTL